MNKVDLGNGVFIDSDGVNLVLYYGVGDALKDCQIVLNPHQIKKIEAYTMRMKNNSHKDVRILLNDKKDQL